MPRAKSWCTKRKFTGNIHTRKSSNSGDSAGGKSNSDVSAPSEPNSPRPILDQADQKVSSASKKKLSKSWEDSASHTSTSNIIVSLEILSSAISQFTACKMCKSDMQLEEDVDSRNGLACKLLLKCSSVHCKFSTEFWTSNKCNNNSFFESNCRLFYGLRCIGKGPEAGKMFCGIMNLPRPSTNVSKYTTAVRDSLHTVAQASMKNATLEAIEENSEATIPTDLPIAFDGTWQKRGFVSKNAACTVTSVDTGKVLDVEVLSKYCSGCQRNKGSEEKKIAHEVNCLKNYEGTSGGMETVAAVTVCQRSVPERGVRYVKFLGDGDSKAFNAVSDSKPYGDVPVEKLECIGHVSKRMGTRLRNLKKKLGGTLLSDGKTIKGAGRLTDTVIDKFQQYYGNAIRGNVNDLEKMRAAVWAIYCHSKSTDAEPCHILCPPAPDTWCKYNKAIAEKTVYKHIPVPGAVMEAVRPIFKDLVNRSLLRRCLHGKTQNVNESFNNIVWSRVPKNVFVGRKTLELGVYDAVITWNDGNIGRIEVMKQLGITDIGNNTVEALKSADESRIRKAELAAQLATKEARVKRRRKLLREEEVDNPDYCPGGF